MKVTRGNQGQLAPDAGLSFRMDNFRKGLFLLVVMNISRVHQHFAFLVPLRPALVITGFVAAYAYMNPRFLASGSVFRTWPAKIMAALAVMACLSVPFGISMGHAALFILDSYWKVLLGAFLIVAAIRSGRDLFLFVWAMVISMGALSYLSLFVFRMVKASDDGFARLAGGYSYDANDIGCVAVVGVALTLLTYQISGKKGRIVSAFILLALAMTVAKTGSRGAFVGLMGLGAALVVLLKSVSLDKRIAFVVVALGGVAIAAPQGYWDQMFTVFSPKEDYNWTAPTGRRQVAKRGIGYMLTHPIAGVGIDNFAIAEGTLSSEAQARRDNPGLTGLKWSAAHNSFVQVGAEEGVPGLVLFTVLVFGPIVGLTRLRRRLPAEWAKGDGEQQLLYYCCVYLPVAFVGFACTGFFVSFGYSDLIYTLVALVIGTYVAVERRFERDASNTADLLPTPVRRTTRGGLAPLAPNVDRGPRYAPR